jgi:hypothetical protein
MLCQYVKKHADNEYASSEADAGTRQANEKVENFEDKDGSRNLRNTLQEV